MFHGFAVTSPLPSANGPRGGRGTSRVHRLRLALGRFLLAGFEVALPVPHATLGRTAISAAVLSGTTPSTRKRSVAARTIAKIVRNYFAA
jgi:hypothetical protein